jgi:BirA family biotin operon repressor/biotin-[acetyl-CoA-carboxylase] ligase
MLIIKLDAIDSTNAFLRQKSSEALLEDYTVIMAKKQTNGRGQMGTSWNSEASKNLTISVFKDVSFLKIEHAFYISIVTSLAIYRTLHSFTVPKLSIKWPNDILSENKKICGVLIENVIKQDLLNASIIGIGLNINQTEFKNLPKASSLKRITGKVFNLDEIVALLVQNLKHYFSILEGGDVETLKMEYESELFRKDKPSTFKDTNDSTFSGFIKGVSDIGNLQVLLEDDIIKDFDLKEITLLY